MRTTLDLDEALLQELLKLTSVKTKTEAIHLAVSELIRRRKMEKLKSLSGKIAINLDWRNQEKAEQEHQRKLLGRRRGYC